VHRGPYYFSKSQGRSSKTEETNPQGADTLFAFIKEVIIEKHYQKTLKLLRDQEQ